MFVINIIHVFLRDLTYDSLLRQGGSTLTLYIVYTEVHVPFTTYISSLMWKSKPILNGSDAGEETFKVKA